MSTSVMSPMCFGEGLCCLFTDQIEGRPGLEPGDLRFVVRMVDLELVAGAVAMVQDCDERLAGRECVEAEHVDGVVLLHLVVIRILGEGEREHALLS